MSHEERGTGLAVGGLDEWVDGIWEEATALEAVLVVHDYASLREALARTLAHYGYRASAVASREQALRALRSERPDVILLDMALAESDGAALALELAARPEWREIPVLALTSDRLGTEALRRFGFREELVMPVEQKQLLAAVDRALEPARRRTAAHLWLERANEQCRLPLEDQLRCEHLTLFFRFAAATRVEFRPGNEILIRRLTKGLAELGIHPDLETEGEELVIRYELTIADALSLDAPDPVEELVASLGAAFPELATRPEVLRQRVVELREDFRRLHRLAS